MAERYSITKRTGYQDVYEVRDHEGKLRPMQHADTREEAERIVAEWKKGDIIEACHDKAQRLTKGARKQMETPDYITYYRQTMADLLAPYGIAY